MYIILCLDIYIYLLINVYRAINIELNYWE